MKNTFICTTQYQLFNIVNIIEAYYKSDDNELIILDCIPNDKLNIIANRAQVFTNIYNIKTGPIEGNFKSYFMMLLSLFMPYMLRLPYDISDRVFITATEIYSRIIAMKLIKKSKCSVYFYEDGLATYTDVLSKNMLFNKSNKLIKMRFGSYLIKYCKQVFVYRPEYVINNDFHITLKKIPQIKAGSRWAERVYNIFNLDQNKLNVQNKVIYFDSRFLDRKDIEDTKIHTKQLAKIVQDKLIIKPHPSKINVWKKENVPIIQTNNSFEILYLLHSFKDNILVSAFSTACVLPKIIFDEEPKVILLYNLYRRYPDIWDNGDFIYKKIQAEYSNKENFWIPSNVSCFYDNLSEWLEDKNTL